MKTKSVLRAFEESIPSSPGVRTYVADYDAESGRSGFGAGMNRARSRFLQNPGPTLIIGLERKEVLAESKRGFRALLSLNCVRYLELPFTTDELVQAADSVRGIPASVAAIKEIRAEATLAGLEALSRNVTHVLEGGIRGAVKEAMTSVQCVLDEQTNQAAGALRSQTQSGQDLKDVVKSIDFFRARLDVRLVSSLARELDGIAPREVTQTLQDQLAKLRQGVDALKRLADGIEAWVRGDRADAGLHALLADADSFLQIRAEAAKEFKRLSRKVSVRENRLTGRS